MSDVMHSSASRQVQCALDGCEVMFVQKKPWAKFCSPEHRNKFHQSKAVVPAMEKRIAALEERVNSLEGDCRAHFTSELAHGR